MLKIRKPWVTKTEQKNLDMMAKNLIALDDGIEAKKERAVCKRCGVVYEPRMSHLEAAFGVMLDSHAIGPIGDHGPFRPDQDLLINPVTTKDYCPHCEEDLMELRYLLVKVAQAPWNYDGIMESYTSLRKTHEEMCGKLAAAGAELVKLRKLTKDLRPENTMEDGA